MSGETRAKDRWLGAALIGAAALYEPVLLWARNARDLSSPARMIGMWLALTTPLLLGFFLLGRGRRSLPTAWAIASLILILMNWEELKAPTPLTWCALALTFSFAARRWLERRTMVMLTLVALLVVGAIPLAQVAMAYLEPNSAFPTVESSRPTAVEPTGAVEDVLVVVVDSYPSNPVASQLFDHDTAHLISALGKIGFTVPAVAWSQFTFTSLSVPSLLELQPITTPYLARTWTDKRSLSQIVSGDNLVVSALRSAGFSYTHIESGWDMGECGGFDRCLRSHWLDEATSILLGRSLAVRSIAKRYGQMNVVQSIRVVENLRSVADSFGDDKRDLVFAHILLPHPPVAVDSDCEPTSPRSDFYAPLSPAQMAKYGAQLACADKLMLEIAAMTGPKTAVLITGDHGTGTGGQVGAPASGWTDSDIAERFGVFLALKVPDDCPSIVEPATNVQAMAVLMSCAVDIDIPPNNGRYMIGIEDPVWVEPSRMERIQAETSKGVIHWEWPVKTGSEHLDDEFD